MIITNGATFHSSRDGIAIRRIVDAADAVASAKRSRMADEVASAQTELRAATLAANDRGVSWQSIGDALGIRRGAAYQRFRRRSQRRRTRRPAARLKKAS